MGKGARRRARAAHGGLNIRMTTAVAMSLFSVAPWLSAERALTVPRSVLSGPQGVRTSDLEPEAGFHSPSIRGALLTQLLRMLALESRTNWANGAFGRQERHDSAGMRLVTAASGWRSSGRRSMPLGMRQAGQRTHRNQ